MKLFLTLKHWQLLLLLMVYGFWSFEELILNNIQYIGIAVFVLWAFAIGYYGQKHIETAGLKRMNVLLLTCSTVFILITIVAVKFYTELPQDLYKEMDYSLPLMVFVAIAAGMYVLFFAAKTIAKIEYRSEVTFDDCFTNFLLILIFIWGIWILQPKINRLFQPYVSHS
jgi:hypothetical protein